MAVSAAVNPGPSTNIIVGLALGLSWVAACYRYRSRAEPGWIEGLDGKRDARLIGQPARQIRACLAIVVVHTMEWTNRHSGPPATSTKLRHALATNATPSSSPRRRPTTGPDIPGSAIARPSTASSGPFTPAPGGEIRPGPPTAPGGPSTSGSIAGARAVPGADSWSPSPSDSMPPGRSTGTPSASTTARSEPADHAPGRPRGGYGSKTRPVRDGQGPPMAVTVTAGPREACRPPENASHCHAGKRRRGASSPPERCEIRDECGRQPGLGVEIRVVVEEGEAIGAADPLRGPESPPKSLPDQGPQGVGARVGVPLRPPPWPTRPKLKATVQTLSRSVPIVTRYDLW